MAIYQARPMKTKVGQPTDAQILRRMREELRDLRKDLHAAHTKANQYEMQLMVLDKARCFAIQFEAVTPPEGTTRLRAIPDQLFPLASEKGLGHPDVVQAWVSWHEAAAEHNAQHQRGQDMEVKVEDAVYDHEEVDIEE